MRDAFIRTLLSLAQADRRIVLLTGDLGFGVLNEFREKCPEQLINVGVAEQNLAGVGAGMALSGHVVFTYSIGNFPTLRCLEQVRNDICYHGANVKIVTVGGGLAYGALGYTHHAVEDLAVMRALPGLAVVAPGDPVEVERLVPQIAAYPGPVYLRLGRAGEERLHSENAAVEFGHPTTARTGDDVLLLTVGGMLPVALAAAELLVSEGVESEVVSVHTLSPLDGDEVARLVGRFPLVVTCEEHTVTGGLGGAIAEVVAERGLGPVVRRFGLPAGGFPVGIGSQEFMRAENGIDATALRSLVLSLQPAKR